MPALVAALAQEQAALARRARERSKPGPDVATAPSSTAPSAAARDRAEALRQQALAACEAQLFDRCGDLLDRAGAIDPAGESDPRVIEARAAIDRALAPEPPPPSPFEKQDKPHAPPPR